MNPASPDRREFDAAYSLRRAIRRLNDHEPDGASFTRLCLARAQVHALMRYHALSHGVPLRVEPMSKQEWSEARKVPAIVTVLEAISPNHVSVVKECLAMTSDTFALDAEPKRRSEWTKSLEIFAAALLTPLESESLKLQSAKFRWWITLVSASLFIVVALSGLAGIIFGWSKPANLALHRNVLTSSQFANVAVDHRMLVDGDRTTLGFHTNAGPNEFVVVDLGSEQRINKVIVTNRLDCCKERTVPLRLEVSSDGENFTKLQDRVEIFDTWVAESLHAKARYVRLRLLATNCLHLSELEVY